MHHDRIGPFELLRVVASDSRGIVYEARDAQLKQRLAVWVLPSQPLEELSGNLPACVKAEAQLQHPNIVAVQDRGWHGEVAYVATEFVDGETLAQYLARVGRLPAMQGLALSVQLLSALEHAHEAGQVHGAINLDHLLVTRTGQVKVTGLGWSGPATSVAMQAGTLDALAFIAPEQLIGQPADRRADLYSAAVVAHVLVTGSLPAAALEGPVDGAPPSANPMSAALQALFERGLAQDPDARYATAAEFSVALQAAVGTPTWVRTTSPAAARARGHRARRWFAHSPLPAALRALKSSPAVHRMGLAFGAYCAVAVVAATLLGGLQTEDPAGTTISPPSAALATLQTPPVLAAAPAELVAPASPSVVSAPAVGTGPSQPLPAAQDAQPQPERELAVMGNRPGAPSRSEPSNPERVALAPARAPRADATTRRQRSRVAAPVQTASPAASCRKDSAMAQEICTAFRCATAEFRNHSICVRMHAEAFASNRLAEPREGP